MMGWQWHQLEHMQIICTTLQTDNLAYPITQFFTGRMLFLTPNQQCQSTEGDKMRYANSINLFLWMALTSCTCECF